MPLPRRRTTDTWRGLTIAPENRCSPYSSGDYPYPESVEDQIVAELGGRETAKLGLGSEASAMACHSGPPRIRGRFSGA